MVDVEDLLEMRNNPALAGWRQVAPAREIMADRDVNAAVASWATRVNSKDLPAQPVPGRKFKVPTIRSYTSCVRGGACVNHQVEVANDQG